MEGAHGRGDLRSIPEAANAGGRLLLQPLSLSAAMMVSSAVALTKGGARTHFIAPVGILLHELGRKPDLEQLKK